MKQETKREYSEKDYCEGKVPDDQFDEYLKKYGYAYTPMDYKKIPLQLSQDDFVLLRRNLLTLLFQS